MGLKLESVVPWGRSLKEYICMFALTPTDLQSRILDCAGGPASFNAEMIQQGYSVISCDPIYQFTVSDIAQRIQQTYPVIVEGVTTHQEKYVWQEIKSPTELGQVRMNAMTQFLDDFPLGLEQGRYRTASLPVLDFQPRQFDLALCSHFLFTYSEHLSYDFHREAIATLCQVATEVRIFPLLTLSGEISPYLQPLIEHLTKQGYLVTIQSVLYEFQKGGNQMLQICHGA
ncbi:MAG: SAM-dependent methyltransferase [Leptolyngbyaceae bacterium]|nr:SAM-dependent methyltransferase [Leptolyngbyaceae bacterium]